VYLQAHSNLSQNRVVDNFARHQLGALPRGAVALTSGDLQYYPLLYLQACPPPGRTNRTRRVLHPVLIGHTVYLQACEGARPDVAVLNTAMMKGEWFAEKQVLPRCPAGASSRKGTRRVHLVRGEGRDLSG
jgi:hypothetical protein